MVSRFLIISFGLCFNCLGQLNNPGFVASLNNYNGGNSTPFFPTNIPNCNLWLSSQAGITAPGSPIVPFGWTNQVSPFQVYVNESAVSTNSTSQGVWVGTGGGGHAYFLTTSPPSWSNTLDSIWIVFSSPVLAGSGAYYSIVGNGVNSTGNYYYNNDVLDWYTGTDNNIFTVAINTKYSFIALPSGLTYTNGVAANAFAPVDINANQTLECVGEDNGAGGSVFYGYIDQIAVYTNYSLTISDRANLNTFSLSH